MNGDTMSENTLNAFLGETSIGQFRRTNDGSIIIPISRFLSLVAITHTNIAFHAHYRSRIFRRHPA